MVLKIPHSFLYLNIAYNITSPDDIEWLNQMISNVSFCVIVFGACTVVHPRFQYDTQQNIILYSSTKPNKTLLSRTVITR